MSKFSDYINSRKESENKFFFGEDCEGVDYVRWTHFKNEDEIIIATSNVKYFKNKNQFVLVVDDNKVVYLKDWQVKSIKKWINGEGVNAYAVKLNRKFFKSYTFSFSFDDVAFTKEDTFDSLVEVAKLQDQENQGWKLGHYDC